MASATSLADMDWYDGIHKTLSNILKQAGEGIFNGTSALIHSNMSYTIVMVTIMVWLILRLKNGYPTKEEMFGAGKWLMLVLSVYAIFYSYESYTGFTSLFAIPMNWVRTIVTGAMGFDGSMKFIDILNEAVDTINKMCNDVYNKVKSGDGEGSLDTPLTAFRLIGMFWFWVYVATLYIGLFGGLLIMTGSQFISALILTTAPIVIPFIIYKSLRAYFFSWLKLFISYSLYAPIAIIIIKIILEPVTNYKSMGQTGFIDNIVNHTFVFSVSYMLIVILGIYFMTKIPNWVSQIMGVQGLDGAGTGAAQAIQKTAGAAVGAGTAIGAARGVGGMIAGAKNGSGWGRLGGAIAGGFSGGMKGMGQGLVGGATAGNKTLGALKDIATGGGKGAEKVAQNASGATAKA